MLCKHFKGDSLLTKNIYRIVGLGFNGKDIDTNTITYTGENDLENASNLVVYVNIFQEGKVFAREYEDISSELNQEKQLEYNQTLKVQPLTKEEIAEVMDPEFIIAKKEYTESKFKKK